MGEEASVLRTRMVNNQLRTFDVTDHRVQDAFLAIPRERYVPKPFRGIAYSDEAIPIAVDPTGRPVRAMTRPAVLARLLQLAHIGEDDVVLLVGAGTGYSAALIGCLADSVIALECDEQLAEEATATLEAQEVFNVSVVTGPLQDGYAAEGPYDITLIDGAIDVTPTALIDQLKEGGRLITVEGRSLAGRAKVYERGPHGVSHRTVFNAAADLLPGFVPEPSFVF
ncbi:MAG: protein-L-isoaspartate O-methyltransferase [Pseudomonadota bacterium]